MSPKSSKRRAFVFSLHQNFGPQLAAGQLVYQKEPTDLIERLTPVFFIGIGRLRLITGPYELTTDKVIYNPAAKPQSVARMDETDPVYGVWQEIKLACPYHVSFKPLVPIKYGVKWDAKFCKEFDLSLDAWRTLIQVELSPQRINALVKELTEMNTNADT